MARTICASCRRNTDPNRSFCTNCGSSVFIDDTHPAPQFARPQSIRAALPSTPDLRAYRQQARDLRAAARRAAPQVPQIRIAPLIRFIVFVLFVWYAAGWLLAIPEVIVLKNSIQQGQMSDEDVKGALDAIRARIDAALGNSPSRRR